MWAAARDELQRQGLSGEDCTELWLESARTIVGRLKPDRAEIVLRTAVRGLARLPWDGPTMGRTDLASSIGGNSHALDDGTVLGALILRGIAAKLGEEPPASAAGRRLLWEQAGVQSDEVSTTVLTLGLRPCRRLARCDGRTRSQRCRV